MSLRLSNRSTGLALAGIIVAMLGLAAASVPLYSLFCNVTGYGGTTRRAEIAPAAAITGKMVEVQFNADVDRALPWSFRPLQRSLSTEIGEEHMAFYEATNRSDHAIVARAVYNVTPFKAGAYFAKIACFCFNEQTLEAGQKVEMPVSFFIDPALLEDPDAEEVRQVTLSYTFYLDEAATAALARKRAERPTS